MLSQAYFLVRAIRDGRPLVARPRSSSSSSSSSSASPETQPTAFLLLFQEKTDAMSYLNTHAGNLAQHFRIEPVNQTQIPDILHRWNYRGIGLVEDSLVPQIEFLVQNVRPM
ncbi:MAG: hypothetical protein WBA57_02095 [Elainellaceae cyanobacterium]